MAGGGTPLSFFHLPPLTPLPSPQSLHFGEGSKPQILHSILVALFQNVAFGSFFGSFWQSPLHSHARGRWWKRFLTFAKAHLPCSYSCYKCSYCYCYCCCCCKISKARANSSNCRCNLQAPNFPGRCDCRPGGRRPQQDFCTSRADVEVLDNRATLHPLAGKGVRQPRTTPRHGDRPAE